jgi:hypothetical protein
MEGAMNIREMSFGNLLKVGFWITFAPYVFIVGLIALIGIPIAMFADIPVGTFSDDSISLAMAEPLNPIQILFVGLLITLVVMIIGALASLVEALIGVIVVRLYTWMFMNHASE